MRMLRVLTQRYNSLNLAAGTGGLAPPGVRAPRDAPRQHSRLAMYPALRASGGVYPRPGPPSILRVRCSPSDRWRASGTVWTFSYMMCTLRAPTRSSGYPHEGRRVIRRFDHIKNWSTDGRRHPPHKALLAGAPPGPPGPSGPLLEWAGPEPETPSSWKCLRSSPDITSSSGGT